MQHANPGGGDDIRRQAESTVSTVTEQATQTAETQLSKQKEEAASTLHAVAEAIRDGGQRMRSEQPKVASLAEQAATKVDEVSSYIREHEVRDFVREAESFARRERLLFLGGAFALGFLAARFLKASSPTNGRSRGVSREPKNWYAVGPGVDRPAGRSLPGRSSSQPASTTATGSRRLAER